MTEKEAIYWLEQLDSSDEEAAHSDADGILLKYLRDNGGKELADKFEETRDRIGFWYA